MKRLGENLRLRTLSLLIAIILWVYVMNIQNPEIRREFNDIHVNIINRDYGMVLTDQQDITTTVKVKGKQEFVKKLSVSDIEVIADLKEFNKDGSFSIPLKVNVSGVQGMEIIEAEPNKIDINIERLVQIQKMVDVEFTGESKSDAKYNVKSVRPNVVTISGPQSLLQSIGTVKVFIDVTNQEKDISLVKKYRVFNKKNQDITDNQVLIKDNQSIQVDVDYSKSKEVPISPVLSGEIAKGYYISQLSVKPDKIKVYGQPEKILNVNKINTGMLSILGLNKSVVRNAVLVIPSDLKAEFQNPVEVNIGVGKEVTKTFDLQEADIKIIGSSDGYVYKVLNSEIRMELVGRDLNLDTISVSSLGCYIDVDGLKLGEHRLPININPNDKIKVAEESSSIKVRVIKK